MEALLPCWFVFVCLFFSYSLDHIYSSPWSPWSQLRLEFDAGGDFLLLTLTGEDFAPGFLGWTVFSLILGDEDSIISSLEGSSFHCKCPHSPGLPGCEAWTDILAN